MATQKTKFAVGLFVAIGIALAILVTLVRRSGRGSADELVEVDG
jgi:hypothetical protein